MTVLSLILLVAAATVSGQEVNSPQFRTCSLVQINNSCASDRRNFRRGLVVSALECNDVPHIIQTANWCSRSSNGIYCGAVGRYSVIARSLMSGSCADAVTGAGACTDDCRSGLMVLQNDLGCCINTFYNNSESSYASLAPLFSDNVWSACNMSALDEACTPEFDVTEIEVTTRSCTRREIQNIVLSPFCTAEAYNNLTRSLAAMEGECDTYLEYNRQLCSIDDDEEFCATTPPETLQTYTAMFSEPLTRLCTGVNTQCTDDCREVLQRIQNNEDCCVNTFFNSTFGRVAQTFNSLMMNEDLFELCEVTRPGLECEIAFPISRGGSMPLKSISSLLLLPLVVYITSLLF